MNTGTTNQNYIKVITTGNGSQRITLPQGFARKPVITQEQELLDICRRHYIEHAEDGKKKIRLYRYYFSNVDYLDYSADEVTAGV